MDEAGRAGAVADAVTAVAVLALALWVAAAEAAGSSPWRTAALIAGTGICYGLARAAGAVEPLAVPLTVMAAGVVVAVVGLDVLLSGPLESPLGYANATGAFFALVSAAGCIVAARDDGTLRWVGIGVAVAAAAVPWLNGAHTAAVTTLLPPLAMAARPLGGRVRGVVLAAGALVVAALASTVVIGLTHDREGEPGGLIVALLSERRPVLWADALDQVAAEPARGVGVGGFAKTSPTAQDDPDARWAHNEYLQLAAETGVAGGVLALLVVLCALARMWLGPRDEGTAAAAAALAGLSISASVDYVLHYVLVALAAGAVAGAGVAAEGQSLTRLRSATSR